MKRSYSIFLFVLQIVIVSLIMISTITIYENYCYNKLVSYDINADGIWEKEEQTENYPYWADLYFKDSGRQIGKILIPFFAFLITGFIKLLTKLCVKDKKNSYYYNFLFISLFGIIYVVLYNPIKIRNLFFLLSGLLISSIIYSFRIINSKHKKTIK